MSPRLSCHFSGSINKGQGGQGNGARLPDSFKVSPELLETYVGCYDYRSGVMNVTADGNKLFAQITGQSKMRIYPKSETVFEWRVVKAQVEFVNGFTTEGTERHSGRRASTSGLSVVKKTKNRAEQERTDRFTTEDTE